MPLTEKGEEIKGAMTKQYGPEKGERVFYASKNAGKITGVDRKDAEEKEKDDDEEETPQAEDLPTELEAAEQDLETLERQQEQEEEGRELNNAIADRKKMIRGLRDAIKSQARDALIRAGEPEEEEGAEKKKPDKRKDALEDLESKQDAEELKKRICDAVADAEQRFDRLVAARAR